MGRNTHTQSWFVESLSIEVCVCKSVFFLFSEIGSGKWVCPLRWLIYLLPATQWLKKRKMVIVMEKKQSHKRCLYVCARQAITAAAAAGRHFHLPILPPSLHHLPLSSPLFIAPLFAATSSLLSLNIRALQNRKSERTLFPIDLMNARFKA